MSKSNKLYKSHSDKVILGVCGGLGEYFGLDLTLIRVIWIIVSVFSFGLGVIAYILSALVMPDKPF